MSEIPNFIPAKYARIVWQPRKHQENFEIKVYFKDPSTSEDAYSHWPFSSGNVYPFWSKLNAGQLFAECMKILFWERVSNKEKVKKALYEFGKIKELVDMRAMYHALYYHDVMPPEGLEKSFYAFDFCDGK